MMPRGPALEERLPNKTFLSGRLARFRHKPAAKSVGIVTFGLLQNLCKLRTLGSMAPCWLMLGVSIAITLPRKVFL